MRISLFSIAEQEENGDKGKQQLHLLVFLNLGHFKMLAGSSAGRSPHILKWLRLRNTDIAKILNKINKASHLAN